MVGVGALEERNPRNPRKAAGGMSLSAGIAFSLGGIVGHVWLSANVS
jgi:hypothetical protein